MRQSDRGDIKLFAYAAYMPLFLIVYEIYRDVKSPNGEKFEIFFELFGPPCRNALADLDGSTPYCAQVCALHIEPHLEALRKIEMVAVHCTNETPPFLEFLTPPPPARKGLWTPEGRGTSANIVPTQISVHALLRYRSKTTKMQKFPIDSYSNEKFISPFFHRPNATNPQKGRRQSTPACKLWRESTRGCREIVDRTKKNKKTYSKTSASVELTQTRH